jgi:hypothetical protein
VPLLRRLVAGCPPRRPGFSIRLIHVGFVLDKVTLGLVFSGLFPFHQIFNFSKLSSKTGKMDHLWSKYQGTPSHSKTKNKHKIPTEPTTAVNTDRHNLHTRREYHRHMQNANLIKCLEYIILSLTYSIIFHLQLKFNHY